MQIEFPRPFVLISALLLSAGLILPATVRADESSDLRAQVATLQQQLNALQAQMAKLQAQVGPKEGSATTATASTEAPAKDSAMAKESDNSIGGYGEIAYNGYVKDSSRNQADLKRFVLFFGHRFNDRLSFNSEVEWEHAVTSASDKGESEIEQAWLNYRFDSGVSLKAGLFLMPFGFLNQSHEPPTFFGVERNLVETRIIPSTWREGGFGLYGTTESGFSWDVGLTTGFDVTKLDDPSAPLAASHQELQFAHAANLAGYGALNYRGVPGLTVGTALFYGNSAQHNANYKADDTQPNFAGIDAPIALWDAHARWQANGWDLQALYANGHIGQADRMDRVISVYNIANPSANRPYVPKEFYGWFLQAGYKVWEQGDMSLTPFVRYERFNTQSQMPGGIAADPANADRVWTIGVSFMPHPQVVLKADFQKFQDNSANDRYNLGLGYMF